MTRIVVPMSSSVITRSSRGDRVDVTAEEISEGDISDSRSRSRGPNCATAWPNPEGVSRPLDPMTAPCDFEPSPTWIRQHKQLLGVESSCRIRLRNTDVPNNDLGVVKNFSDVVSAAKGLGPGSETLYSAAMTATVTLNAVVPRSIGVGIYVMFDFNLASTIATSLRVTTENCESIVFGQSVNRDITFDMLDACVAFSIFMPFAAQQASTNVWGPHAALIEELSPSRIVIYGLPASSGVVKATFVGPYGVDLNEVSARLKA